MLIDHLHKAESRPMVAEEPLASKIRALQKRHTASVPEDVAQWEDE